MTTVSREEYLRSFAYGKRGTGSHKGQGRAFSFILGTTGEENYQSIRSLIFHYSAFCQDAVYRIHLR